MKTFYLDHNIIRYYVGKFPSGIDAHAEREALETVHNIPDCRFVISPWNICEAAAGTDSGRVNACAEFIESLDPLYIPDHPVLFIRELQCYVYNHYLDEDVGMGNVFADTYAQHLRDTGIDGVSNENWSAAGMIRWLYKNPPDEINQHKQDRPAILREMQDARALGVMDKEFERQVNEQWFSAIFPDRRPDNKPFHVVEKFNIVQSLIAQMKHVHQHCPALWVDSCLSDYRTRDPSRNPEPPDAIDLMHAVPAVAYCSAFVTYDGYTREGAKYAAKQAQTDCKVKRLVSEATSLLCG